MTGTAQRRPGHPEHLNHPYASDRFSERRTLRPGRHTDSSRDTERNTPAAHTNKDQVPTNGRPTSPRVHAIPGRRRHANLHRHRANPHPHRHANAERGPPGRSR
jgi:hypothetical protein